MTKWAHFILVLFAILLTTAAVDAQRKVTPVEQKTNRVDFQIDKKKRPMIEFVDSARIDSLEADSIAKIYPKYPAITDVTIGVNFWEPIMRAFGQKYGGYDVSLSLNMWNRLVPQLEFGFGSANSTPEEMNFTYVGKTAFYSRIGASYNFLFKKKPDYQLLGGFKFGYSPFKYDITNISLKSGYWDQERTINILNQSSHALWTELTLGVRVKIVKQVSLGWTFRYHFLLSCKDNENSRPWYIPGFGTRNNKVAATFSVFYTLPLSKHKWPQDEEVKK